MSKDNIAKNNAVNADAVNADAVNADIVVVDDIPLHIDNKAIKINGFALTNYKVAMSVSDETVKQVEKDLSTLYTALENATKSKVKIGEAIDAIRTNKTLEKLTYTENNKVKTITEKATFDALAKMYKYSATTLKESYIIYTTFYKPCTDGNLPIIEINGYPVNKYNDTQLLAIAYALNNDNVKGVADFNDTIVNPALPVKSIKTVCDKLTGKDKYKDKDKDKDKSKDKETPLEKMPLKDFIGKIGDLLYSRFKTVDSEKQADIYKAMLDSHKALEKLFLLVSNNEKPENSEEAENK